MAKVLYARGTSWIQTAEAVDQTRDWEFGCSGCKGKKGYGIKKRKKEQTNKTNKQKYNNKNGQQGKVSLEQKGKRIL